MGFLPPDDEHIKATVLGIADELTREGLVLRYRVEGTDKVSLPSTERAVVDMLSALSLIKADHRQCGQPFGSAGDREPGTDRVRYLVCPVSEPVRPDELDLTAAVHGHDASEPILGGNRVDYL